MTRGAYRGRGGGSTGVQREGRTFNAESAETAEFRGEGKAFNRRARRERRGRQRSGLNPDPDPCLSLRSLRALRFNLLPIERGEPFLAPLRALCPLSVPSVFLLRRLRLALLGLTGDEAAAPDAQVDAEGLREAALEVAALGLDRATPVPLAACLPVPRLRPCARVPRRAPCHRRTGGRAASGTSRSLASAIRRPINRVVS